MHTPDCVRAGLAMGDRKCQQTRPKLHAPQVQFTDFFEGFNKGGSAGVLKPEILWTHWDQIAYTSPYKGGGPTMHTRSCIPPAHAHILRGGWNASVPCHCVGVKPRQHGAAPYMHCMKWGQLTSD